MTKEDQILEILHEHTKLLNVCIHTLDKHTKILDEHTKTLNEHTKTLNEHTKTLNEHTKILDEHTKKFAELSEMVNEHTYILLEHTERIDKLTQKLNVLGEKVDNMHHSLILLENDFSNKSSALFDGHDANLTHLERNDKDIGDLQTISENHSIRLISLEIDSKEHTKQLENLSSK